MRVLSLNKNDVNYKPNFGRQLTKREICVYKESVEKGLKILDKELGLIIHNSSMPTDNTINTKIGTYLSKNTQLKFTPFLRNNGITSIQQEPSFLRQLNDPSPYSPMSTAKNIYMIPLERLADDEYNLLDKLDFKKCDDKIIADKNNDKVNYDEVRKDYKVLLKKAYNKFCAKDSNSTLKKEFEQYKKENYNEQEPNAIFEILTDKYNGAYWKEWDDCDKNLYKEPKNIKNLETIREEKADDIDFFMFKQWLTEREISRTNKINNDYGIRTIADIPVAYTNSEIWQNQDLFMEDFALGAPPASDRESGQFWGFEVLKPETLFNQDGSLGKGGEFLKKRFEKVFKTASGGARIDHIIGLIDPYVYKKGASNMTAENSGRLYSSPNSGILWPYARHSEDEYSAVIEKIVFPAAKKYGIEQKDIICEDLGFVTPHVANTMNKLNLAGITVSQYGAAGPWTPKKNIVMPGSHDNISYIEYTDKLFNAPDWAREHEDLKNRVDNLAKNTIPPNEDFNHYKDDIMKNKSKFMAASFAELFTCPAKKVQIFFTDFFGIGKTYNKPGTTDGCWTLKLESNFEDIYYENLQKGTAVNLPEAISTAIKNKGKEFSNPCRRLLHTLDKFAEILKS